MLKQTTIVLFTFFALGAPCFADYDLGRSEIAVSINNEIYPYKNFATYVLPQEHLGICLLSDNLERLRITANTGTLDPIEDCRWIWTAPDEPGQAQINILRGDELLMSLNVFVMTPASELVNGRIDNVIVGEYPEPIEDSPIYQQPDGFIRVTEDMVDTPVSPNFVLGQFITSLDSSFPKYIVLRERLLLKLEALLERLNEQGIEAESLAVIAGYMTPDFNRSIGGQTHSRHIYGGAASVIIDRDADGKMDDLDGNGVIDTRDGGVLFDIIDELYSEPGKEFLRGGLFLYSASGDRGPAVLLDARGFRMRWPNASDVPPLPENLRPKHKRQFE
ncbi:MAG: D-Ala-D-Ala carboxypeptidase family metallohydrolase [Proteobacteria bacterium]|nr:D-Ala-D-Ala carboxypeptidase family metallohydrolase [Pseudomonadota bacterium]